MQYRFSFSLNNAVGYYIAIDDTELTFDCNGFYIVTETEIWDMYSGEPPRDILFRIKPILILKYSDDEKTSHLIDKMYRYLANEN